jgi:Uma2 family endonuclease
MRVGEDAPEKRMTYNDYLTIERGSPQRYEWRDGVVFAMAGGTLEHSALCSRMNGELLRLADRCGCQIHTSDAKIRVRATGLATYSDGAVVCGPIERDPDDRHAMTNPVLIVEVLSDSSEAYDRGDKFAHDRMIPSLRHYVLISQHERRIEVYSRDAEGLWVLREGREGGSVPVAALQGVLDVSRVYDGIELEAPPPRLLRASQNERPPSDRGDA